MNHQFFKICATVALVGTSFAFSLAHAGVLPGSVITSAEKAAFTVSAPIQLGQSSYQILTPKSGSGAGGTLLMTASGLVGQSKNQVVVSGPSESDLASALQTAPQKAVSSVALHNGKMTVLQMANFQDAVALRNALLQRFPSATVSVPVSFSNPTLK